MQINYRRKYLTTEEQISLTNDYNSGMDIEDIINKYKISKATIYRTLKRKIEEI